MICCYLCIVSVNVAVVAAAPFIAVFFGSAIMHKTSSTFFTELRNTCAQKKNLSRQILHGFSRKERQGEALEIEKEQEEEEGEKSFLPSQPVTLCLCLGGAKIASYIRTFIA